MERAPQVARRLFGYIHSSWQFKVTLLLIMITSLLETFSPAIVGGVVDLIASIAVGRALPTHRGVEAFIYLISTPTKSSRELSASAKNLLC